VCLQSSTAGASSTKPVPVPPKKTKNAVGVQRKISNIPDELAYIPATRASTNQPAETKGSVKKLTFFVRDLHDSTWSFVTSRRCLYMLWSVTLSPVYKMIAQKESVRVRFLDYIPRECKRIRHTGCMEVILWLGLHSLHKDVLRSSRVAQSC